MFQLRYIVRSKKTQHDFTTPYEIDHTKTAALDSRAAVFFVFKFETKLQLPVLLRELLQQGLQQQVLRRLQREQLQQPSGGAEPSWKA